MKKYAGYIVVVLLFIVIFVMGRFSHDYEIRQKPTITEEALKIIDSLKNSFSKRQDTLNKLKKTNDSLIRVFKDNKQILQKNVNQIKKFTPDSRNRWNDSVLSSAGLK